jgi:hypothetical protein
VGVWVVTLIVALARAASAGDGVIEISQSRALAGGVTTSDTTGFPVTLDAPGSYRLTSDLDSRGQAGAENVQVIHVTSPLVTLDLNGFALIGPATCTGSGSTLACSNTGVGAGVWANETDVRIVNGRIEGAAYFGLLLGDRGIVQRVTVRGCGLRGVNCGVDCLVEGNTVERCVADGIRVDGGSRVVENTSRGNLLLGISALSADGVVIRNNTTVGNGSIGINAPGAGVAAIGNVALGNGGVGIQLAADSGYAHNLVNGNAGGTIPSGVDLGRNACDGSSSCP